MSERHLIRICTGEGRKGAKARGVRFGRPSKLTDYQRAEALRRLAAAEPQADIARSYSVDPSNISRLAKRLDECDPSRLSERNKERHKLETLARIAGVPVKKS
jgi:DNA invertase Pin-like site-specific DNA recombinase